LAGSTGRLPQGLRRPGVWPQWVGPSLLGVYGRARRNNLGVGCGPSKPRSHRRGSRALRSAEAQEGEGPGRRVGAWPSSFSRVRPIARAATGPGLALVESLITTVPLQHTGGTARPKSHLGGARRGTTCGTRRTPPRNSRVRGADPVFLRAIWHLKRSGRPAAARGRALDGVRVEGGHPGPSVSRRKDREIAQGPSRAAATSESTKFQAAFPGRGARTETAEMGLAHLEGKPTPSSSNWAQGVDGRASEEGSYLPTSLVEG
jgi:hypothetical protein